VSYRVAPLFSGNPKILLRLHPIGVICCNTRETLLSSNSHFWSHEKRLTWRKKSSSILQMLTSFW
jgi:hypothetical protein